MLDSTSVRSVQICTTLLHFVPTRSHYRQLGEPVVPETTKVVIAKSDSASLISEILLGANDPILCFMITDVPNSPTHTYLLITFRRKSCLLTGLLSSFLLSSWAQTRLR